MERIEILVRPNVVEFLDELIQILYQRNYFGFRESAEEYVSNIYASIPILIHNQLYKKSPNELAKYGDFYIS